MLGTTGPAPDRQQTPSAANEHHGCPSCGNLLAHDAIMCTTCGYSVYTKQHVSSGWTTSKRPESSVPLVLAPLYLLFRPTAVFRDVLPYVPTVLIALMYWFWGVVYTADRWETRYALGSVFGQSMLMPRDWPGFWSLTLIGSALNAVLIAYIGGWWHRQRLAFCGAHGVAGTVSRRVYAVSGMVYVVPTLALWAFNTCTHRSPVEAFEAGLSMRDLVQPIAICWCAATMFAGARWYFGASAVSAAIWFIALPLGGYFAAGLALALVFSSVAPQPSGDTPPRTFEHELLRFAYPAHWNLNEHATHVDRPDAALCISVESGYGANVGVTVYRTGRSPKDELAEAVRNTRILLRSPIESQPSGLWGNRPAQATRISGDAKGQSVVIDIFILQLDSEHQIEIRSTCIGIDPGVAENDIDFIRSTFQFRGPTVQESQEYRRDALHPLLPFRGFA